MLLSTPRRRDEKVYSQKIWGICWQFPILSVQLPVRLGGVNRVACGAHIQSWV